MASSHDVRFAARGATPSTNGSAKIIRGQPALPHRSPLYGTLMCDLEQRRIVDLLPNREPATIEGWLGAHPEITVISRDRGGG